MRLLLGTMLSDETRREVLRAFIYRHLDTTSANDAEWLRKHAFYVRRDGKLSRAHKHCVAACMAEYGERVR